MIEWLTERETKAKKQLFSIQIAENKCDKERWVNKDWKWNGLMAGEFGGGWVWKGKKKQLSGQHSEKKISRMPHFYNL